MWMASSVALWEQDFTPREIGRPGLGFCGSEMRVAPIHSINPPTPAPTGCKFATSQALLSVARALTFLRDRPSLGSFKTDGIVCAKSIAFVVRR